MSFHAYQSCGACTGGPKPGTQYVMQALILKYPYIRSLGIYSCRPVAGTSTFSIHACGRAGDPGIPTLSGGAANKTLGNPPLLDLIDNANELGIMGCIYARVRYDAKSPRGRYYGGVHPHNDHIHFEQTDHHARTLTRAKVFAILGVGGSTGGATLLPISSSSPAEDVKLAQDHLNFQLTSGETPLVVDGAYGPATTAFVKKKVGSLGQTPAQQAGTEIGYRQWNYIEAVVVRAWVGSVGGDVTKADLATAITNHAKAPASSTVHPHRHSEGTTGPPIP